MNKPKTVTGPQLTRIRNGLELSQQKLAAKCQLQGWDVSRDIIASIELRKRFVKDTELLHLAKVLNVAVDLLLFARRR